MFCFFKEDGDHRELHVLTHSFPTRRSSDLEDRTHIAAQVACLELPRLPYREALHAREDDLISDVGVREPWQVGPPPAIREHEEGDAEREGGEAEQQHRCDAVPEDEFHWNQIPTTHDRDRSGGEGTAHDTRHHSAQQAAGRQHEWAREKAGRHPPRYPRTI